VPLGGVGVIRPVIRDGVTVRRRIRFDRVPDTGRGQGLFELLGVVIGERTVVLRAADIDLGLDLVGLEVRAVAAVGDQSAAVKEVAAATRSGTRPATINDARPPMQ
jgi:hypothetical protein